MENDKVYAAIQSLTDNPFTIIGDDLDNIIWHFENKVKPNKSQIINEMEKLLKLEKEKNEAKKTIRTSALAKLAALGLTEDEIAAL